MSTQPQKVTFKERLRGYCEGTTMHGVRHIHEPGTNRLGRLIWLLVVSVSGLGCVVAVTSQIAEYFRYEVHTVETRVDVSELNFPSVTMCNFNYLKRSYVERYPRMADVLGVLDPVVETTPVTFNQSDPELMALADLDMRATLFEGAHALNETLVRCIWQSVQVNCSEYFTSKMTDSAVCLTFHSTEFIKSRGPLKTTRRGATNGLKILANVQQEEYLNTMTAGFQVVVHDPHDAPPVQLIGAPLSPGVETHVSLEEVRIKRLPRPYGDCKQLQEDSETSNLKYFHYYSHDACYFDCLYRYVEQKCRCRSMQLESSNCTIFQAINCAIPMSIAFQNDTVAQEGCSCKHTCQQVTYDTSVAFASFPSKFQSSQLSEIHNVTEEYIRSNMLHLVVYFKELKYKLVKQQPAYSLPRCVADVGGLMGLALGASVLTLVELFEFLAAIFILFCKKLRGLNTSTINKNTNNHVSPKSAWEKSSSWPQD